MNASDLVVLRGGFAVPVYVLTHMWDLEDRGLHFNLDDNDLYVGPPPLLTDQDRAFIRAHRDMVAAVAKYVSEISA